MMSHRIVAGTGMDTIAHWERVYAAKKPDEVSWYRPHLEISLRLIASAARHRDARIIDVGGGESTLADDLVTRGYRDVTVLDVSGTALDVARERLGDRAARVRWIRGDVTTYPVEANAYDVWHDRAVFHFLTRAEQRKAYVAALLAGTTFGSAVIMATFALDGPDTCSGLPVQRYSPRTLAAEIGPPFVLTDETQEMHTTPSGAQQPFSYVVFRREVN
jgi:SAM-dependent methyltransferase